MIVEIYLAVKIVLFGHIAVSLPFLGTFFSWRGSLTYSINIINKNVTKRVHWVNNNIKFQQNFASNWPGQNF